MLSIANNSMKSVHQISIEQYPPDIAWKIFAVMMVGNFMAIFDFQIVASSINEMSAGLGASQDEIIWVQTIYLIGEVIGIALAASLSKLFSTKTYFAYSALGFALASLCCGFAWDIPSLLTFRAIQGFMGGGMVPTAMAVMFILFPAERLALPLAIVGMVNTAAPAIGPILGGWITNNSSWQWLFFINLLPGLAVYSAVLNLPGTDSPDHALLKKINWTGIISMALFLGLLVYVMDQGPRHDWLDDRTVLLSFVTLLIAGGVFFYNTFTVEEPIVDLFVFRDRNFFICTVIAFTVGIILYGLVYVTPFFLGTVRGLNSEQIGWIMLVTGVSMFATALLYRAIFSKFDSRYNIFFGLVIVAAGIWLNVTFTPQTDFNDLFWAQILRGFGLIICMISISKVAMETLPRTKIRGASGVINLTRNIGGAIGFALINTLLSYLFSMHQDNIKSNLNWTANDTMQLGGREFAQQWSDTGQLIALNNRIMNIVMSHSLNDLLTILALFTLAIACLAILLKTADKSAIKK